MFKIYKKYLKKYKLHLIFGPIFKILEAVFELLVPLVLKYMIDKVVNNNLLDPATKINRLWICGGILLAFAICGFTTTMIAQYIASKASQGVGTDIRDDLYKHINELSYKELDDINPSSLITRLTNDVNNIQNSVAMLIRLLLRAPFIVIGATIMSFIVNVTAGLIFLGATLVLFLVIYIMARLMLPYSKKGQEGLDSITSVSKENLSGNRIVRAFNKEEYEKSRLIKIEHKVTEIFTKLAIRQSFLDPLTFLVVNIATIIVLYVSGIQFTAGGISQGDIQALVNYFTQIQIAVVAVTGLVIIFARASASSNRVNEVFKLAPSIKYGSEETVNTNNKVAIKFNKVSFSYSSKAKNAINDVSFIINKGETVGIIGSTGSGKSSLVNLINRFYDSNNGEIYLFNKNIKCYSKRALSNLIGTVSQRNVLFNGTIKSNLLKAKKDANDEELVKSLKVAQAYDFVSNLSKGLDAEVYQSGKNFSGGQKQRLCIARAILKDSPILILDDSSSALDYKTDMNLRDSISKLNKTTLIISQRARSVKKADKIMVFDKGNLVDIGSHSELIKSSKIYKEICVSQDEVNA